MESIFNEIESFGVFFIIEISLEIEQSLRFLLENNIALLVTSHLRIAEGIKKLANDKIIVINSATNHGDNVNNLAGLLHINKYSTTIVPKLIDNRKGDKKANKNTKNLS